MTAPGDFYPGGEAALERDRAAGRLRERRVDAQRDQPIHLTVLTFRDGRAERLNTTSVTTRLYDAAAIDALDPPQSYREPRAFVRWVHARAALRNEPDATRVVVFDEGERTAVMFDRDSIGGA